MTRSLRTAALFFLLASTAGLAEVIVLKGGVVVQLQRPPVRRGNNVLLTRADGTLLSVPASEIDVAATAAARAVPPPTPEPPPAPPATLAEAARASHEAPKARVRITDSDVSHAERSGQTGTAVNAEETPKEKDKAAGAGRVEVADYTQEKSGEALVVRGTLRNPGGTTTISIRMTVTALDAKGQAIASGDAGLSSVVIEPSKTAAFSITLPVGTKSVASLKFAPRWTAPVPPASGSSSEESAKNVTPAASGAPAAAAPTAPPPPPAPTPYGRGSLYAPPAPNAPSEAPKDGKTGYIPGASSPSNQPKPPS